MNDEELLGALAGAARARGAHSPLADARLERLASGELTPEERDALVADAKGDPEKEAMIAALEPLGADFKKEALEKVVAARAAHASAPPPAAHPSVPPRASTIPPMPHPPHKRRLASILAPMSLAAAALLGVTQWITQSGKGASDPPLPEYAMTVQGGMRTERGVEAPNASAPIRVLPASEIEILARPKSQITGPVAGRLFLVRDGATQDHPVPITVSPSGVARAVVTGPELHRPPRVRAIVLAVGREAALPADARALASVSDGAAVRLYRVPIELVAP